MNILPNHSAAPVTAERVTRGVNLIARNLQCHGAGHAAAETADHIRRFWAPALRSVLLEQAERHPERFSWIAREAIAQLGAIESGNGSSRVSVSFPMPVDSRPA